MNPPTMVGVDHVRVAPGAGLLARHATALLFVPDADADVADRLVAAFEAAAATADGDDDALVDAVSREASVAASGETAGVAASGDSVAVAAGFVLVTWGEQLRLVVLGPTEVRTDHDGLPMLSGTGSASWVERRIRLDASTVNVVAGAVAAPSTDLRLGCVRAGGFAAAFTATPSTVTPSTVTPSAASPSVTSPTTSPSAPSPIAPPSPGPASDSTPGAAPAGDRPAPSVDPTEPIGGDRLAALRAAVRSHDQVVSDHVAAVVDPASAVESRAVPSTASQHESSPVVDDEVTLAPDDPRPDDSRPDDADPRHIPDDRGESPDVDDADRAPFVVAIRCGRGHVNPSHVTVCRVCGDLLDANAVAESIRQPPLALLEFGGGHTMPIDRSLVLGRQPDLDAAQATDRALTVVVDDDASVSRTHLRIDVEDWSLTVTDCGSRSGTAIVTRPGEEPRVLEPWMPHELPVGARLFLGGPASVAIRSLTSAQNSPRSQHA